ncbi:cobalt transporter CbiM [Desulforamulus profundi]|uniref:Cobalt transporter CbiM n=1 Tax=Desulforamulus profundi TaxID=1383067 RepID=A0A2C6L1Y5_9FIRM|nr:cobalt transporter CbiM [Desulforamulus profundi]PHJ37561.1 cobalt transporter CbiM [Desulforamulus profundi]
MHIPDGVLPTSVCLGGYVTAGAVTWYSLRKIGQKENPRESIPRASLLTAAFFVASWIHIPVPPTSVHLVLNGLLGAVLGYYAFPAILIGLFFQAVMFQHGGLTTLGVNATIMGVPALLAYHLFRLRSILGKDNRVGTGLFGFLAGAGGIGLAAVAVFVILVTTIPAHIDAEAERASIYALITAHIPLMVIEGVFTALLALFLQRVKPELLEDQ